MVQIDKLKNSGVIIVDIRTNYDYIQGHIEEAINVPYYNLLNNYSHYLSKYQIYYLYCEFGIQSREISERLNLFGYHTDSVEGGYKKYKEYYY